MRLIFYFFLLVAIYAIFSYGRFEYILKTSNVTAPFSPLQTLGSGKAVKYLAAGDSTAAGNGVEDFKQAYPYLIAKNLATHNTIEYQNIGVSGATTSDLIKSRLPQIIAAQPDIVTISIGVNDNDHLVSVQEILNNYRAIISELTLKTKAIVYITDIADVSQTGLLPLPLRTFFDSRARKLNPQILALGTNRVKFVDIHAVKATLAADKFHPNADGYINWAAAFNKVIGSQQF